MYLNLRHLAELKPAENMTDITLGWYDGLSLEMVVAVLKIWRHLRRLTFLHFSLTTVLSFEVLYDFIMGMRQLSYLKIVPIYDSSNCVQLESLRGKVNELILPRCPNLQFSLGSAI